MTLADAQCLAAAPAWATAIIQLRRSGDGKTPFGLDVTSRVLVPTRAAVFLHGAFMLRRRLAAGLAPGGIVLVTIG